MGIVDRTELFDAYNVGYVQALFEQYLQDPSAVDERWRAFFETGGMAGPRPGPVTTGAAAPAGPGTIVQLRAARAAGELVDAFRLHGHRAARLDPLGSEPPGHPMLQPEFHGITTAELDAVPPGFMADLPAAAGSMTRVLAWLRETYTGTIGYEFEHLQHPAHREWLREQIEAGAHRQPLSPAEQRWLLGRLTEVEALEQFLHRSYLGAKRFSIEGTDLVVPMLDVAVERAAAAGARAAAIGMAHRGRLNVLAHVLGVSAGELIGRFEGRHAPRGGTGDVKYHIGAEGTYATRSGESLGVLLAPNPSHLEFVNPVIEGMTRARQTDHAGTVPVQDENLVLPILIHGDAAFSGQGVVPETLNLMRLPGYRTGGTLHIIENNQIGFTTLPGDSRSTVYPSDLARGFDIPIFHVNADDPEACLAVTRLAMAYREHFHSDVVIDLVGYRRFGHNEGDEPAYTQPLMYRQIAAHPTVRRRYADALVAAGVLTAADVDALWQRCFGRLVAEQATFMAAAAEPTAYQPQAEPVEPAVDTAVAAGTILALDRALHDWPADLQVNAKLARQLERRARLVPAGGRLDWAHAEALALATLLADGVPIRLSGQDTERGTFSQRHLVLHDAASDRAYCPLGNLSAARASFEVRNSPLSELAALGFEYGYSVAVPQALVLWEGQFGDFVNGAQVIVDQFISAGPAKWDQESRLVLLLPHGYEGQWPEHSSARPERFLQLAAEHNLRVANCTTPAQYFHLLRYQALQPVRRPLVVMTPKSLLRHPKATSPAALLSNDGFHPVLADDVAPAARVQRVVLCTGKLYYDLAAGRERAGAEHVAIVRVELLYPFPGQALAAALAGYDGVEVAWAQEEPRNMGAWGYIAPRQRDHLERPERYLGFASAHEAEQARIVAEAMAPVGATESYGLSPSGRGARRRH
ncbi:MAG: 2-oxoglutarate dehydrogenase E1 component [Gemmatimonadetes bacterium]|nr:2-oxoglutarate dehydrogenase E1 component [Gemmatimonadota bacterium]